MAFFHTVIAILGSLAGISFLVFFILFSIVQFRALTIISRERGTFFEKLGNYLLFGFSNYVPLNRNDLKNKQKKYFLLMIGSLILGLLLGLVISVVS